MKTDRAFADRAVDAYLRSIGLQQENKDSVARHALEDLRRDPRADANDKALSPDFLHRLERHAQDAATEEAREKWGRVVAAEVRKPGSITARAMRLIDELDPAAAMLFEELCVNRLADTVPTCLTGELKFPVRKALVEAGLLVDPGTFGHANEGKIIDDGSNRIRLFRFETNAISIPAVERG
ncbi:DUF2806 domain-containing protein [Bradyrhizobium sp. CCGE-LA001]|uniref:DUF2806 domain-containing protein n=1 Tax=Bradyrhizobium sp. CCGE-LA001 TaxID=1223566 RepID=UPI001314C2E5|nr:DUF2806 domain-containing protein [Bradyrhizobium sp. CCGE-LA001]